MKRVFHHYKKCEEYAAGMWRNAAEDEREGFVLAAAALMRDPPRFEAAMLRAVREWRYSCEHNLTARMINKRAWLGHAGCLLAVGSPEDLTRLGWHRLTNAEQDAANAAADRALAAWESLYLHLKANPNAEVYGGHACPTSPFSA